MPHKKPTSFSLSEEVLQLLKLIADKNTRKQSQQLEVLIREEATRLKIKVK